MRALLDTNVFLWSALDDPKLSRRVSELVRQQSNRLFVSPATGWEIVIKHQIGKINIPDIPGRFVPEVMSAFSFENLPIDMRHALHVETLPRHHRDPFDRILIAQSLLENLPILTADPIFSRYGVEVIW